MWTAFVILLAVLWGREVLHFGEQRREGTATREDYLRFRRRTLGIGVLLVLAVAADMGGLVADWLALDLRGKLLYYGICFIMLIWLLIIAARDMKAIGETWVHEQNRLTVSTLRDLESRMRSLRDPDDQPIPPLDFSGEEEKKKREDQLPPDTDARP